MFGIARPCRHRLRGRLFGERTAHLCGLCLTLRDLHGQSARLVTNYDGLLVSVLTEAQNPAVAPHRTAGPCALRRLRRADVVDASAVFAQLAGQPRNAEPLAEAGRHFGRLAHLLDAVEDLAADEATGSYNPLIATGTTPVQAAERCAEALGGLRRSVALLDLERPALAELIMVTSATYLHVQGDITDVYDGYL